MSCLFTINGSVRGPFSLSLPSSLALFPSLPSSPFLPYLISFKSALKRLKKREVEIKKRLRRGKLLNLSLEHKDGSSWWWKCQSCHLPAQSALGVKSDPSQRTPATPAGPRPPLPPSGARGRRAGAAGPRREDAGLTWGRSWRWRRSAAWTSGCCARWWRSSAPTPSRRASPGTGSTWWWPAPLPALMEREKTARGEQTCSWIGPNVIPGGGECGSPGSPKSRAWAGGRDNQNILKRTVRPVELHWVLRSLKNLKKKKKKRGKHLTR